MNIFKKRIRDKPEKRSPEFDEFIRGDDIASGVNSGVQVDELTAMQTSAVYACVRLLGETVASLPCALYKKEKDKRVKAEEHPLHGVLAFMPNSEMTSFNFREVMMTSLLLYGNAYARIIKDKAGHVKELWYLKPRNMEVERNSTTGKITYTYSDDITNKTMVYKPEQIFHIIGLGYDGVKGLSPIQQARESVGLAIATEEYGARFFGNGAKPGGVLEHPGVLKDPEKLRESWNKVYQGTKNSNKIAVLEEGLKYHEIGMSPEQSQFLQTRKYQLSEICRIFRVPPHMVGELERSTFSNIEHQSIDFVTHTIRPWLIRWEQAIYMRLLNEKERALYYPHFNVDGLLRGDFYARMEGYSLARQNGWMSANEIRELEDMNPISKEDGGDLYLVNGNMMLANINNEGGTNEQ
ncbi:MAG: phage portal protein [Bacillota bacterium]